jgi:hypothetical protein
MQKLSVVSCWISNSIQIQVISLIRFALAQNDNLYKDYSNNGNNPLECSLHLMTSPPILHFFLRKICDRFVESLFHDTKISHRRRPYMTSHVFWNIAGFHCSRTFYLRIHFFTLQILFKMIIFQSKRAFLSANSRFTNIRGPNYETYLSRITRDTRIWSTPTKVMC